MKVGDKCNKADKVIRSATGHFVEAHTAQIGFYGEKYDEARGCPFTKDHGRLNGL